jgi:putative ubiquitin-RnfH superfamily antitoxin RatB of RatAB toxin-antitoxin module
MSVDSVPVEVVYALPDVQHTLSLRLPAGATVADALRTAASRAPFDALDLTTMAVGVFGDRVTGDRVLEPGDRVELYRPLVTDPREARRRRARSR